MAYHKWALWDKNEQRQIKRSKLLPTIDQSLPKGMDKNLEWLEIVRGIEPVYDEETERLSVSFLNRDGKLNISYTKENL